MAYFDKAVAGCTNSTVKNFWMEFGSFGATSSRHETLSTALKKDQAADEFSGENNSRWGIETYKDTILLRCSRFVRWLLA